MAKVTASIKLENNHKTTSAGEKGRKGNPSTLLVGMQTGEATVENNMEFPQKTKVELPYNPAIPLLGIYPKKPKTLIQNQTLYICMLDIDLRRELLLRGSFLCNISICSILTFELWAEFSRHEGASRGS